MEPREEKRVKWSREKVIESIQARHKSGSPLNYQSVVADDEKLTGAARRYFGSWDAAMEAAGFESKHYKNPQGEREFWDREKIIARTKQHIADGNDVSAHAIQKLDSKLYSAAVIYFGSWSRLIEHLGIDYNEIRKTQEWSREKVIEQIQSANAVGADLSDNTVSSLSPQLYAAAHQHCGSWNLALEAAGVDPESARRTRTWTRERLIDIMRSAREHGVSYAQLRGLGILQPKNITDHFDTTEEFWRAVGREDQPVDRTPNRIRKYRTQRGVSQTELGVAVGKSHRWIGLVECGELEPTLANAVEMARVLNVQLEDLFG